jgi:parallel beta-helix repeat protein
VDTGEQMLKVSFRPGDSTSSDNGLVEWCIFEYSAGVGPQYYIGGVDAHQAYNWIIRNNIFRHIRSPESDLAEHAIHFWSESNNTLVEHNFITNCDRGIGFGLGDQGHVGGMIRNNMVHTTRDVGIGLENSSNTAVYNNTVFTENYPNSIEYRFSRTQGGSIINNLTNAQIAGRDGGTASVATNVMNALASWFADAGNGDLHLITAEPTVVDQGQTLADVTQDIDCEVRPKGAAYDIGADEL